MKQILLNAWEWLVKSSANPEAVSLTVKGILLGVIPVVLTLAGFVHLTLTDNVLTDTVASIANLIDVVLTLVAGGLTVYGLFRKIVLTVEGKNQVINQQ